jgi:hypothetical protein
MTRKAGMAELVSLACEVSQNASIMVPPEFRLFE